MAPGRVPNHHVGHVDRLQVVRDLHVLEFPDFLYQLPEGPHEEGDVDEEDANLVRVGGEERVPKMDPRDVNGRLKRAVLCPRTRRMRSPFFRPMLAA